MTKSLGLGDKFTFGKYKRQTIKTVLDIDPKYLGWAIDTVEDFHVNKKVLKLVKEAIEDKAKESQWDYIDQWELF